MTDEQKIRTEIKTLERQLDDFMRSAEGNTVGMQKDLEYIRKSVDELKKTVGENYVTRSEFEPIKKGFYAFVSVILLGVIGAMMALVIK